MIIAMIKSKREIKDFGEIVDVLERCTTMRLGIHDEVYPYVVPLSYGYEVVDGKIVMYFHGAREGFKHVLLAKNNHVCVEADIFHDYRDTGHSVTCEYESIIAFGTAEIVTDRQEAEKAMDLLLRHSDFPGYVYNKQIIDVMYIYRITIDSITGKRRFLK